MNSREFTDGPMPQGHRRIRSPISSFTDGGTIAMPTKGITFQMRPGSVRNRRKEKRFSVYLCLNFRAGVFLPFEDRSPSARLHRFYRRTRGRRPEHQLLLQPVSGGFSLTEGSGPEAVVFRCHLADWSFREGKLPSLLGRFAVWSGSTVILGSLGVPTEAGFLRGVTHR